MRGDDLRERTKEFAKQVIRFCRTLPKSREAWLIGGQLFRAGTSVGANYRAVCRAKSKADFVHKMRICLEEADEVHYWLEILVETEVIPEPQASPLIREANELVAIFVSSLNTARP